MPVARFLHSYFPWRTPFVNLRNHRKVLVIDGRVGLHRRAEHRRGERRRRQPGPSRARHAFPHRGPVVEQLTDAFADDWLFTTGETARRMRLVPGRSSRSGTVTARVVPSGPDEDMEQIEFVALHAISCARQSIRVVTPYFLPGEPLTMALGLAAMRGIKVDILLPENSNHVILDWARQVPLAAADRGGLPHLAAAGALRPFQADDDRRFLVVHRQRQLGHAQLPPELRAERRAARRRLRAPDRRGDDAGAPS